MKNNKVMLVLKVVQCLNGEKSVGLTTIKKIPYVLHCCGIDLGVKFRTGSKGPYSYDFNDICKAWEESGIITIEVDGTTRLIHVSDKFKASDYAFTERELCIADEVVKLFKRFRSIIEAEMFALILERKVNNIKIPKEPSRYDSYYFSGDMNRLNQVLCDFEKAVRPYLDNPWFC